MSGCIVELGSNIISVFFSRFDLNVQFQTRTPLYMHLCIMRTDLSDLILVSANEYIGLVAELSACVIPIQDSYEY